MLIFRGNFIQKLLSIILIMLCFFVYAEEKICVSIANGTIDHKLILINPDGTNEQDVFSWAGKPVDTASTLFELSPSTISNQVLVRSDYAWNFTPYENNIFSISVDSTQQFDQHTPGPNSGKWNLPGPYGTLKGKVTDDGGLGIVGAQIFVEGVEKWVYSDALGEYKVNNVPLGSRWAACQTLNLGEPVRDWKMISVVANQELEIDFKPNLVTWMSNYSPCRYQNRIYYLHGRVKAGYIDLLGDKATFHEIYTPSDLGSCIMPLKWMNIRQNDGRVIIVDWATCSTSNGIHICDMDGGNIRKIDFKAAGYVAMDRAFWHPTNPDIFLASFTFAPQTGGMYVGFGTYNISQPTAQLVDYIYINDTSYNHGNVELCGFSPQGNYILYSYYKSDSSKVTLAKFPVDSTGDFPSNGTETIILSDRAVRGATWINYTQASLEKFGWMLH